MQRAVAFGPWVLVDRIGLGARCEVYRARRSTDGVDRWFAVKRALAGTMLDRETEKTLAAEAELLSKLDHPGIVKVHDAGSVAGVPWVAYELVDGLDLGKLLDRARAANKTIPLDAALTIALELAKALDYVHRFEQQPIVHRDVGPSNVLVGRDGRVKLADFGIAKVHGRNTTTGVGEIKGTIRYMCPEQVRGDQLDPRADQYALGAVLLEIATGRPPFEGLRPVQILQELAQGGWLDPDKTAASLPETMRNFLRKVLAPHAAERYHTTAKLLGALNGLIEELGVHVGEPAVMRVVGELFPASTQAKTFEESHDMADEKGGSDLDVFEGLAKKSVRSSNLPSIPASSPPASIRSEGGRVSGLPAPVPPPPSLRSGVKTTLLGVPVPPGATSTPMPLPPPSAKPTSKTLQGNAPPPPPPPTSGGPPALPPPASSTAATPPPPPPPKAATSTPLPPPTGPRAGSAPPPKPPSTLVAAVPPPPKPPASIGSAVGLPSSKAPAEAKDDAGDEKTPPVGSAVKAETKKGASVDMDWEEEEESTHVFEKRRHAMNKAQGPRPAAGAPPSLGPPTTGRVGLAGTLLMSSGSSAAPRSVPAPPAVPQPVPPPIAKTLAGEQSPVAAAPAAMPAPASYRKPSDEATAVRRGGGSKVGAILGGLALVAVVGLIVYVVLPRQGDLKITLKSKTGQPVAKAEIYVDGQKKCDTTPCLVSNIDAGSRSIRVIVNEEVVADQSAKVEAGREEAVTITLDAGSDKTAPSGDPVASATTSSSAAPVVEGTGFKVSGPTGVKVLVDGKDKGALGSSQLMLKDLPPGEHTIKFDGGENYKTVEKKITVVKDKMEDLGEHKPPVVKGLLTVELRTEGATIQLSGTRDGKKFDKKVNAEQLKKLAIPTDENWKITVTKKGHDDFSEEIKFDDGVAEKTLTVALQEKGKPTPPPTGVPTGPLTAKTAPTATTTATATEKPASGTGTLSMNSVPISNVILDGVPVGKTPIGGRSVSAGKHTVTFKHPEKGSKTVTVDVKPGGKAVASVRFE